MIRIQYKRIAPIEVAPDTGGMLDVESVRHAAINHCALEECVQPTAKNRRVFPGMFD
jgi:hypothetical protein